MKQNKTDLQPLYFSNVNNYFTKYLPASTDRSVHTVSAYKAGMKHFGRYVTDVGGFRLSEFHYTDATYDFVLDFRNYMHDVQGLAPSTCNLYLAANKSYISYSAARDISLQPVDFAVGRVPGFSIPVKYESIITNETGLTTFLDSPPNNRKGVRDKAILCTLYDGALRGNELVSLLYGEVSICENTSLIIHGKGRKERTIYLGPEIRNILTQYCALYHQDTDPLRPFFYTSVYSVLKPMTTRNLEMMVNAYAARTRTVLTEQYGEKANEMFPGKVTPHTLRRTRATLLLRDGTPIELISSFLGHANVEVTRKHYAVHSEEQKIELANKASGYIHGNTTDQEGNSSQKKLWDDDMDDLDKIFDL